MHTNLYLFLDFDGVLHPEGVGPELEFCHLQGFEDLMRQYPQVLIVFSSSWRLHVSFEKLITFFSSELHDRIVGATPHLQELVTEQGHRQRECEQWLASNAPGAPWLAVDDRASYFDAACPQLVLLPHIHAGGTGLEGEALALLKQRIDQKIEHLVKS
jgi:hypothetical protein